MTDEPKLNSGEQAPSKQTTARARKPRASKVAGAPGVMTPTPQAAKPNERKCLSGHEVGEQAKFCPQCGIEIRDEWNAPVACGNGHALQPTDRFCAECGLPVSAAYTASSAMGTEAPRPKSDAELTPQERAERMRLHDLALRAGKENPAVQLAPGKAPANAQSVVIHVLVDGFGAFGNVWFRGQELEVWPGHPRWQEAQAWIFSDTAEQFARYGRQMFGQGPWPGARSYTAGAGKFQALKKVDGEGSVAQPSEEELAAADAKERARGRRVPLPIT